LDEAKFGACLGDASRKQVIMRDVAEARGLNITGTPSFVIGTIEGDVLTVVRMAKGAPSFEVLAQEIEKLRNTLDSGATPQTK
jgi:protein-disulfide isomerase